MPPRKGARGRGGMHRGHKETETGENEIIDAKSGVLENQSIKPTMVLPLPRSAVVAAPPTSGDTIPRDATRTAKDVAPAVSAPTSVSRGNSPDADDAAVQKSVSGGSYTSSVLIQLRERSREDQLRRLRASLILEEEKCHMSRREIGSEEHRDWAQLMEQARADEQTLRALEAVAIQKTSNANLFMLRNVAELMEELEEGEIDERESIIDAELEELGDLIAHELAKPRRRSQASLRREDEEAQQHRSAASVSDVTASQPPICFAARESSPETSSSHCVADDASPSPLPLRHDVYADNQLPAAELNETVASNIVLHHNDEDGEADEAFATFRKETTQPSRDQLPPHRTAESICPCCLM